MSRHCLNFLFLNLGHFLDHLFMLVFATVAALRLAEEWDMSYAALIPYATPGFVAFGVCAIPAGWMADKWSRAGMIIIFFIGIGVSSILTALADSPVEVALGLRPRRGRRPLGVRRSYACSRSSGSPPPSAA